MKKYLTVVSRDKYSLVFQIQVQNGNKLLLLVWDIKEKLHKVLIQYFYRKRIISLVLPPLLQALEKGEEFLFISVNSLDVNSGITLCG